MKNTIYTAARTLCLVLVIVGASVLTFAQRSAAEPASRQGNGAAAGHDQFIGTWQTWVTPRNCATGAAVAPAFAGLLTFAKGQTLSGTSATVPSVFGVWDRLSAWNSYSFTFISLRYNAAGAFIGTQTVRQTADLSGSGNDFTSTGTVVLLDANGATVGTGCATSTGSRFQ